VEYQEGFSALSVTPWRNVSEASARQIGARTSTLAIDLVDSTKKQLVWQGVAQAKLTKTMLDNPGAAIGSVVADIFEKYPVQPPAAASSK